MTIEIEVNGERRRARPGASVAELLVELGRDPRAVAVERNGQVLARDSLDEVVLEQGDRLEVVHFVQGGR